MKKELVCTKKDFANIKHTIGSHLAYCVPAGFAQRNDILNTLYRHIYNAITITTTTKYVQQKLFRH